MRNNKVFDDKHIKAVCHLSAYDGCIRDFDRRGYALDVKACQDMLDFHKNIWILGIICSPRITPDLYYLSEFNPN